MSGQTYLRVPLTEGEALAALAWAARLTICGPEDVRQTEHSMKSMAVSEFKARALRTLEEVARSRQSVLITKRGHPLARVVPVDEAEKDRPGRLADALVFEGDIVSPLGSGLWEAAR